jgi:hypothetical protein
MVAAIRGGQKAPEGSFKVFNVLAMAASSGPDPTEFLGIRLSVTFDTCEVVEKRWAKLASSSSASQGSPP